MAVKGGLEDLLVVMEQIASDVSAIRRIAESSKDGSGKSKAKGTGSGPEEKSKDEKNAEKAEKARAAMVKKQKLEGLAIGLDTITKMSNPMNSKVIAGIEGSASAAELAAGVGASLAAGGGAFAGGVAGRIGQASARAAFNLSGAGQTLQGLKNAQGDLLSRVAGATDAGVVFSDGQLQNIAHAEIQRQKIRQTQLARANKAFDTEAIAQGFRAVSPQVSESDKERNRLLKKIADNAMKRAGGR
jgi:hypothetical protein